MEQIDFNRFIIIIDKPPSWTSFQITDFVRKQLNLNKAAHSGTLDPEVTGVLPVLLGRASRLLDYFIHHDKEYVGMMHMHEQIEKKKIEKIIKQKFIGTIKQLPPVRSRVKREEREREIKRFDILEQHEKDFLFRVECEAGTYIRKLVHDLGIELKIGAHMTELRRTKASIFTEKDAINLYEFTEAVKEYAQGKPEKLSRMLIPIEIITKIMPQINIKQEPADKIMHGSPLSKEMIHEYENFNKGDFIAVMHDKRLVGVMKTEIPSNEIKKSQTAIIAKPKTIFN